MRFAMIADDGVNVLNVILADDEFKVPGITMIELSDDIKCQPGMFYNMADGRFYYNSEFTQTELIKERMK